MRCSCCNKILSSGEIIWYKDQHKHEELCGRCRAIVFKGLLDDNANADNIYIDDVLGDIDDE